MNLSAEKGVFVETRRLEQSDYLFHKHLAGLSINLSLHNLRPGDDPHKLFESKFDRRLVKDFSTEEVESIIANPKPIADIKDEVLN